MTIMTNIEIEKLIDALGLDTVLDHIVAICEAKAEHAQSAWQDEHLAKSWTDAGKNVATARNKVINKMSISANYRLTLKQRLEGKK